MIFSTYIFNFYYAFFDIFLELPKDVCYTDLMEKLINLLETRTESSSEETSILHFHNGYEFIFLTEGQVKIEIDSVIHTACAPSVILLNPFEQHKICEQSEVYTRTVLVLNADELERNVSLHLISRLKCRPNGFRHIRTPDDNSFEQICKMIMLIKAEEKNKGFFFDKYIQNTVYNLLILICRFQKEEVHYNKNLMLIQSEIDKNYAQIETIQQLADRYYISQGHLSRTFKEFTGYSPAEYLQNTRMHHAVRLLSCSDMSVKEICRAVGYRDINNFTRQFKKRFGVSASQLRKDFR